jgi:lycopene beta-cyclase
MITRTWRGYRVAFPRLCRTLDHGYCAVLSQGFHEPVARALDAPGSALVLDTEVRSCSATTVDLSDGRVLSAAVVVDARGPAAVAGKPVGYQKFLGLELLLDEPHDEMLPTLMDATISQKDGFRFFYRLPLAADRILVEDTRYSDGPHLDVGTLRDEVLAYARRIGLCVARVAREETGVLPLFGRPVPMHATSGPLLAGYQGGFFHPTTGYSLPIAARLARHIATTKPSDLFGHAYRALLDDHARQARFSAWLNRMMFGAMDPKDRFRLLERFYGLPETTIARFYGMRMTAWDRARIVCGRPPRGLSVRRALGQWGISHDRP